MLNKILLVFSIIMLGLLGFIAYKLSSLWKDPVFETIKPADPGPIGKHGVLVFSKTNGYRHGSIEAGISAIESLGRLHGWTVVNTENGAFFNPDYLSRFKVVVFLSTTGTVLTPEQKKHFEAFVENGGGYVGIHAAADTEYQWHWYKALLGTYFRDHTFFPQFPKAEVVIEDTTHPAVSCLPKRWVRTDEWYNFSHNPRYAEGVKVLATLNENSYDKGVFGGMGSDHPIIWTNTVGKGRMIYTGIGHASKTFSEKLVLQHLTGAIEWAGNFHPIVVKKKNAHKSVPVKKRRYRKMRASTMRADK